MQIQNMQICKYVRNMQIYEKFAYWWENFSKVFYLKTFFSEDQYSYWLAL